MDTINKYIITAVLTAAGFALASGMAYSQVPESYQDVVTSAVQAGIDEAKLTTLIERARDRGVTGEQFGRLMQPAVNLAGSNLPYEPVLQKALEGLAKRVPPANIVQVLGTIESGMNRSADLVDGWLATDQAREMVRAGSQGQGQGQAQGQGRGQETRQSAMNFRNMLLENTAGALQQDVRAEYITELLNEIASGRSVERTGLIPVASAVGVMGDLPTAQSNPGLTNRILSSALNSGFTANEIQQLPAALNAAQLHSRLPAEAIANGMAEEALSGVPANQILEKLFKGNMRGGPPGFTPPGLGDRPGRDGEDRNRRPATPGRPGN